MKKNEIFLYVLIASSFLYFSCSGKEETSPQVENSEPEIIIVEEEPEIVILVDENNFELTDFIDFPAWDLIGEGMDILKNINSTESVEQLQHKLNLAARTMGRARTAFVNLKNLPEITSLADYPIQIIDLYIEAAEKYSLNNGDPKALEELKKADSLLIEVIGLLEKEGQNE